MNISIRLGKLGVDPSAPRVSSKLFVVAYFKNGASTEQPEPSPGGEIIRLKRPQAVYILLTQITGRVVTKRFARQIFNG